MLLGTFSILLEAALYRRDTHENLQMHNMGAEMITQHILYVEDF